MKNAIAWPAAAACCVLVAACSGSPTRECEHVYTIGDAEVAGAIARNQKVTKPGPMPAYVVPPSAPRAALEPDGSYAGGRVFCSAAEARAAAGQMVVKGELPRNRPWRIYELAASWTADVYEKRPGDYRLKQPAQMVKPAD